MFKEVFTHDKEFGVRNWKIFQEGIMAAAEQTYDLITGRRGRERQTWRWNGEIQEVIEKRKQTYRAWQKSKSNCDNEINLERRKKAKRCVSEAVKQVWVDWNLSDEEDLN